MTTQDRMFLSIRARILAEGVATDGGLAVIDMLAPPGDMPPLHVHHKQDEAFYVTEGELTFHFPGSRRCLGPGDFLLAPRAVPHTFRVGPAGARFLVMSSSAGFVDFVREVSALPAPDPARLAAIAERYDISILGPPGTLP